MKALDGMVVLDLTRVVAGPYCSMILADLGATVIKIENPEDPDYTRTFTPFIADGDESLSGFFAQYNRNKKGITLNLKLDEGKEILKKLVEQADVLIENFRPGVMDKLGVGYSCLKKINPRLIYVAISGFGQYGPYVKWPAYDNSGQALSGLWSINGYPDRPPVRVGTIIGDMSATLFAEVGLLAAYIHALKTGEGQLVDVAQLDSTFCLTEIAVANYSIEGKVQKPLGNAHPFVKPYDVYESKDTTIFFGGYTDKFWKITCEFFGEPELVDDPEIDTMEKRFDEETYNAKVKPKLEQWFSEYTYEELRKGLSEHVPLTRINNIAQAIEDEQLNARDMIVEYKFGKTKAKLFGSPIKLSKTPTNPNGSAPFLGEHNFEIYNGLLNLRREELDTLHEKGVI